MSTIYPSKIQTAVNALLTKSATSTPALRQAVEAYAAGLGGSVRPEQELPAELISYVQKVALYAYKVTDQDVQKLRERGYSEDMIFEITLCASLGASLARLECGLQALKGDQ
jgi:alkylhydroperoxidase family enzyme